MRRVVELRANAPRYQSTRVLRAQSDRRQLGGSIIRAQEVCTNRVSYYKLPPVLATGKQLVFPTPLAPDDKEGDKRKKKKKSGKTKKSIVKKADAVRNLAAPMHLWSGDELIMYVVRAGSLLRHLKRRPHI